MSKEKIAKELDPDLNTELKLADSWHDKVILLLLAILRELKKKA